jgi:hypothetical protein
MIPDPSSSPGVLMAQMKFAARGLLIVLVASSVLVAQQKSTPPATRPTPQITGRLIGTNGARKLILEYKRDTGKGTFFGTLQSKCVIPAKSGSSDGTPLDLSSIPKKAEMTLFYVRHEMRGMGTFRRENVVLAIRFEQLNGDPNVPRGTMIPCFKAAQTPAPKP